MRRVMAGVIRPGTPPHESILEAFEQAMEAALAAGDFDALGRLTRAAEEFIPAEPGDLN